jgi:hypothetical protein
MELYIPPVKPDRDPTNGRFLKGNCPFCKGKKMSEWMDPQKIEKVMRCLEAGRKGDPTIGGRNRRRVIGIKDGRVGGVYPSAREAGRRLGITGSNISYCCNGKLKTCGGIMWFWEEDVEKWSKFLTDECG